MIYRFSSMAEAQPLRVLVVTNMYPTTQAPAYGAFVASQVDALREIGVDITVEFIDGRREPWRYATAIPRVTRLAASGFDLVHAHYGLAGFVAAFHSRPLVVSFCGDDLLGTPGATGRPTAKSRLGMLLSQYAAGRADAIICKSENLRESLPMPKDRARAAVIPNGVDTGRFNPGGRLEARHRLGLDPDERVILFPAAPTVRRKRVDIAEAAVARASAQGVAARLWVVHGVLPEAMPDHYRAADCILVTSDWEGSPNVVKEALCCDVPVVSVDVGDVAHWLRVAPGCRLVPRDPEGIAAGLVGVLTGPRRVDGAHLRQQLAADRTARRVMAVYVGVLAGAAQSRSTPWRHRASS